MFKQINSFFLLLCHAIIFLAICRITKRQHDKYTSNIKELLCEPTSQEYLYTMLRCWFVSDSCKLAAAVHMLAISACRGSRGTSTRATGILIHQDQQRVVSCLGSRLRTG